MKTTFPMQRYETALSDIKDTETAALFMTAINDLRRATTPWWQRIVNTVRDLMS
jgi:hypothetical protein